VNRSKKTAVRSVSATAAPRSASAKNLFAEIDKVYQSAVAMRRQIHAHPELSGCETETAQFVFAKLKSIGLAPKFCCNKTGVVAKINNGAGKTVVLRADMDALPIEESTGLPFSSVNKGVMHACGHDMHTAILISAAQVLCAMRNVWSGTVVFLFQPSEELAPGGAITMINENVFPQKADAVFGLHVSTDHVTGSIGLKTGPDYAGVVDFDVVLTVKGCHGATPDASADPIVCACAMIQQLQTIVSRESPAAEPSVITIGEFKAGTKHNIIPTTAYFGGTIRAMSESHLEFLRKRVQEVVRAVALSYRAQVKISFEKAYPPGYNNPELTARAADVLGNILDKRNIVMRSVPVMLAEDFAYFQKKAAGVYVHLGVRPPNKKNVSGIHTPTFCPDERAMITGIAVHAGLAIDILKKQ